MYAVLQQYTFDPTASTELNHLVKDDFVPLLRAAPGFVAYYWLDSGDGTGAGLSVFEDQEGAEAFLERTADFVREHLAARVGQPHVIKGEITAHAHCGL
jgi:hypothetical protein